MVFLIRSKNILRYTIASLLLIWLGGCFLLYLFKYPTQYLLVFPSFFKAIGEINFRKPPGFNWHLLYITITLCAQGVIGGLFLRLFYRFPIFLEMVASIFLGIGLTTFPLVILAIFFWLHPITILATFLVMGILLWWAKLIFGWSEINYFNDIEPLQNDIQKVLYACAWVLLLALTGISFYHALFFPVTYWDSLIYYVHYGQLTYQQGGFPIMHCLQVGLGLGANYPHLFPLHQAVTATLFSHWSDFYAQFMAPFAGLGSVVILYYLIVFLVRDKLIAILSVLAFRAVPYLTSYLIWTSDYSLVVVYTCIFLMFLAFFISKGNLWKLQPLLCVAAIFPHINYLGWIVWPCAALAAAVWWIEKKRSPNYLLYIFLSFAAWCGIALIWYVRNYIVTGNPVYAFFPEIFGGKNINLDVLRSCENEWLLHGNGAALLGDTIWQRLLNSPLYFLLDWRFAPLVMGIFIPSCIFFGWKKHTRFYAITLFLIFLYLFYEYAISGFYWYHIIAVFPLFAVFVARYLSELPGKRLLPAYGLLILLMGIVPGVSYSLIGAKYFYPDLKLFSYPGISKQMFYRYTFPGASAGWRYINSHLSAKSKILTHDNRYHVFRQNLQIIHLDDCGLTPLYGKPYPAVHRELLNRGIGYYFYIPDENTHPITRQLGHREYLDNPNYFIKLFEEEFRDNSKEIKKVAVYQLLVPQKQKTPPTGGVE